MAQINKKIDVLANYNGVDKNRQFGGKYWKYGALKLSGQVPGLRLIILDCKIKKQKLLH